MPAVQEITASRSGTEGIRCRGRRHPNPEWISGLKLADFAEWLRGQPEWREYPQDPDIPISEGCPIACFCDCWVAYGIEGMPEWANRFVAIFDRPGRLRNQIAALEALTEVEAHQP